jgi:hypothetical protein
MEQIRMLVATPDEILWKGLELGGFFDGHRQQKVKRKTGIHASLRRRATQIHCLLQKES